MLDKKIELYIEIDFFNFQSSGTVCLDVINQAWTALYGKSSVSSLCCYDQFITAQNCFSLSLLQRPVVLIMQKKRFWIRSRVLFSLLYFCIFIHSAFLFILLIAFYHSLFMLKMQFLLCVNESILIINFFMGCTMSCVVDIELHDLIATF